MNKTDNQSPILSHKQDSKSIVDIRYQQTGEASATNELGMRENEVRLKCLFKMYEKMTRK